MGIPVKRVNLPADPVVLTPEQISELNEKLSKARHDINNHLAVMVAAVELIRYKPDSVERWLASMDGHPMLISDALRDFSAEFEKVLEITPVLSSEDAPGRGPRPACQAAS